MCRMIKLTNEQMQDLNNDSINKTSKDRKCKFRGSINTFEKGKCPAFGETC